MVYFDNIQNFGDRTKNTRKSEASMDFSGPEPTDLQDVQAINLAFLMLLGGADGERLRGCLPAGLQPAVQALSGRHVERLAAVPFLLLSLNEADDAYWPQVGRGRPVRDLFTPTHDIADPQCRIATAAAGFLWQLARRNPYATRVISGATLAWCEQLAELPLLHVLECAVDDHRLLVPRLAQDTVFWHRLLGAGVSSAGDIRRAAHLTASQTSLMAAAATPAQRFQSAACYSDVPSLVFRQEN
jgi:hypothetical protein